MIRLGSVLALVTVLAFAASSTSGVSDTAAPTAVTPETVAAWLGDYVRLDTSNPPGNEHRAVSFLRRILHAEGIDTSIFVTPDNRPSLYARLEATNPSGLGALVLLHHMDVVPAGPGWRFDPFAGDTENGTLWGRGAVDAKSLGIAHLAAFLDLAKSDTERHRDLIFLAVADEETGGHRGSAWLIDQHPEIFTDVAAVLGEGGMNKAVNDRLFWWGIEVAQKRPLWLEVTTHGRGGHGSMLNRGSAPHQLTRALARLVESPPAFRVSPAARAYLESVAPFQSDYFGSMVRDLDEIVETENPNKRLFPGVANYLLDTVQVNVLSSGERINVIPEEATARIDIRLLPDTDGQAFLSEIENLLGDRVEVKVILSAPRVESSPVDHEIFFALRSSLNTIAPVVPAFIPGVTDSRYFREHGIPAYGFSPFVLSSSDLAGIHGPNEKISLEAFRRGVETMQAVVRACVTN